MLIWTIGFLGIALLAALFGFHGLASGAVGVGMATFVLLFAVGTGMLLWQLFGNKRSTSPL